jgi:hypothetical protein
MQLIHIRNANGFEPALAVKISQPILQLHHLDTFVVVAGACKHVVAEIRVMSGIKGAAGRDTDRHQSDHRHQTHEGDLHVAGCE